MEEASCPFCSIASKSIDSYIVYEDEAVISVLDINPASVGHLIVFTKKHYNSLFEMPEQEYSALMTIARAIAYSLLLSQGAVNIDMLYTQELRKGNFTPHALIHVIPRYKDDEISYNWNTDIPSQEEFSAMAEKIRSAIESIKSSAAPSQAPAEPAPVPEDKTEQPDNKKDTSPEVKRRTIIF